VPDDVRDEALAELVAQDLAAYLATRSATLDGPVYAVSLYSDCAYGSFGVSIATEPGMRDTLDVPAYADADPLWLAGPASPRWNSGDWSVVAESFVSARTEAALAPLVVLCRDDGRDLPEPVVLAAFHRWARLTLRVFDLVDVLRDLDTAPQSLAFVDFDDSAPIDTAEAIQWAVGADRLHAVVPHWRELAAAVREARDDPDRWRRLVDRPLSPCDYHGPPPADDPGVDPVVRWLRACRFTTRDLAGPSESLVRALAVGESVGDERGPGFEL
jgi:hypothetical protein